MKMNALTKKMSVMLGRQEQPEWLSKYQPAIRATPQEAPAISRPAIVQSKRLGRGMHALSQPEMHAVMLALYHPGLVDLHEQHVLSIGPATHPLHRHDLAAGLELPGVNGTIRVADRIGKLQSHAKFFVIEEGTDGEWVPMPYVGDLLLFLNGPEGPYCVVWSIKKYRAGFDRRIPRPWGRQRGQEPDEQAEFRHQLEEEYFADAGIRMVKIAESDIDVQLRHNLREICPWHTRPEPLGEKRMEAVTILRSFVGSTTTSALEAVRTAAKELHANDYDVKVALYQAIWAREIIVDLYAPFVIDKPMRRAKRDPLVVHAAWFAR